MISDISSPNLIGMYEFGGCKRMRYPPARTTGLSGGFGVDTDNVLGR